MITKKDFTQYCEYVNKIRNNFDVFINDERVIDVRNSNEIFTESPIKDTNKVYRHPDSFRNRKSMVELYYITKVVTKKENIVNTNLKNFLKTKGNKI